MFNVITNLSLHRHLTVLNCIGEGGHFAIFEIFCILLSLNYEPSTILEYFWKNSKKMFTFNFHEIFISETKPKLQRQKESKKLFFKNNAQGI